MHADSIELPRKYKDFSDFIKDVYNAQSKIMDQEPIYYDDIYMD